MSAPRPAWATPAMLLGDLSALTVETDDLSEVNVTRIALGQSVKITVDALSGKAFTGKVQRIAPSSTTKRGDVTYTVSIALDQGIKDGLRWGMTAFVDINVK